MKRRVATGAVFSALFLVVLAWTPSMASAGSPNRVTVTLACDRGVGAEATVALQSSTGADAGGTTLTCGSDSFTQARRVRIVLVGPAAADIADVSSFSGTFAGTCTGMVTLPARVSCPTDGSPGAVLSVR